MGFHPEWLIPIIALIVWIVHSMFRGKEEEEPSKRRGPSPIRTVQPSEEGDAPRGGTDIDQFLEEINRRRKLAQERRARAEREVASLPVVVPVAEPRRKPKVKQPVQRTPKRDREWRATDLAAERIADAATAAMIPEVLPATVMPATVSSPAPLFPPAESAPVDPNQLVTLLNSAEGVKAAILLREVLGPPLCRRRRSF
jgi:hypothetical protein